MQLRKRRERDRTQTFLIEGHQEIKQAISAHFPLQALFFSSHSIEDPDLIDIIEKASYCGAHLVEVTPLLFTKLSYLNHPCGLLAVGEQRHLSLKDAEKEFCPSPFILVVESIEKPGNLGAILRSADAAGIDALFLCDRCTDLYNPNVVRASMGALFSVPTIELSTDEAISWLNRKGVKIAATSPQATIQYTEADFQPATAIVMGAEHFGLSTSWMGSAHLCLRIPMHGIVDSLNVSAATVLLLYEVVRQRQTRS